MTYLALSNLRAFYGRAEALHGVDLVVGRGEIVALLGANGAGKTTTLRAISGLVRTTGRITLGDVSLDGLRPHQVARAGVAHVPEGHGTLVKLSVRDNMILGAYGRSRREVRRQLDAVLGMLPRLRDKMSRVAGTLSGGEQQMLAVGRALMREPKVLLLDEPSFGLSPVATREVYEIVRDAVTSRGITVLLAEQDIGYAMELAERAYVVRDGYAYALSSLALTSREILEGYL